MTGTEQLDEVVINLRAVLDQIEAEERDLLASLSMIRDRKRRIGAMIRAAEPAKVRRPRRAPQGVQRRGPRPETMAKARKHLKRVNALEAIEGVPGSFTTRDFARAAGLTDYTASGALQVLREEGLVRMAGRRGRANVFAVAS